MARWLIVDPEKGSPLTSKQPVFRLSRISMNLRHIVIPVASLFFMDTAFADSLLNANSASAAELAAISQLNESTASVITAGRPFATIGDLNAVLSDSMSAAEIEVLYGKLFVPINLNTASREDILLIPGVGRRMAHEFEEYRPYSSMEQFRREIGKYVDEEEVARLEMYVTLD